jgi:hypothetical protein
VKRTMRALAFVAAAVGHVALVALLMHPSRRDTREVVDEPRMVVVFLEPNSSVSAAAVSDSPAPRVTIKTPPVDLNSAITLPPREEVEVPLNPPAIDWQEESRTAAARAAQGLESERRRKGSVGVDPRFARPAPRAPEFGWDQSKIHRVESLPGGGLVIHLNDRCSLTLSGFLIPMCKLGRIDARGDLFDHIGDRPPDDDR